ncbi:MAG: bifunctional DNA-formamidopyrimidine glycosylase/DNA-(apurinic or apyrimidinic site) lyase [Chloroflexi bacterium]|nr:bifunctional DNA-formamidopyrimidine glycosylase/DNA-(apurinic or apyrimidinic site) lyase [Chloroflexota bacterium]
MPELPEVETIRRDLAPTLVGRRFVSVELLWPGIVRQPTAEELERRLPGQTIAEVARRGKYLLFRLESGETLLAHLKMSGSLVLRDTAEAASPYLRAVLTLDDGRRLGFYDPRKFGRLWLVADENEVVGKLGPEPLEPEFTPQELYTRLLRHGTPIKALLCDQNFLAGIGNIYADEALFYAGIHPLRLAREMQPWEADRLHCAIRISLERALANRGTTFSRYRDAYGEPGRHWEALLVPRRPGAPCTRCGTSIQRIRLRGRGTYFCPDCQG